MTHEPPGMKSGEPARRTTQTASLAAVVAAVMLTACAGKPPAPPPPTPEQLASKMLDEIAGYALWVRRQPDAALREELARVEALPAEPHNLLRLALVVGQRQSELYDAERTAQALVSVAASGPENASQVQLAQLLLGLLPREERSCGEAVCEQKLSELVQLEERRRRELSARIESLRNDLEAERAQREKLESQLEALKSLEEQIKNRDGPQP
jgi:hypothetical protein